MAVSAVRHGNARPASWTSGLASHDTDGVILVTSELTGSQLEQLREADIPLVVLDPGNPPPPELPSVGATNWAAAWPPPSTCWAWGTAGSGRSPGRVTSCAAGREPTETRSALERAGIKFDPALVSNGDFQHEAGFVCGGKAARPAQASDGDLRRQ